MDMNFFLDAVVVLTAPVLTLNVKSSTSSSCSADRSMNSPDQIFSFFLSETVACNGMREDTNLFSLFERYAALLDDDVELDSAPRWALPNGEVDVSFSNGDVIVSWVFVTFASLSGCGFGIIPDCCRVAITDAVTVCVICSDKAWISVAVTGVAFLSCFLRFDGWALDRVFCFPRFGGISYNEICKKRK